MSNKENIGKYKFLLHDIAEAVSRNEESADNLFEEENIDIDNYILNGLKQINSIIKEKETLKIKQESRRTLYFKRVVLAAKIASRLYDEPTFGHVKFQKLVYLGEQLCTINIDKHYTKQAAGPFDPKFMHSIDNEFKRQKWFNVKIESSRFKKYKYTPLENLDKFEQYYNRYFSDNNNDIEWLIDTFRRSKTVRVELIATIYFCWKEILLLNETFTNKILINRFYKWSKEKEKFTQDEIESGISWMQENNLVPEN